MKPEIQELREYVRSRTSREDPSHDFAHISRIVATCERIGKELGARMEILLPAALLHDVIQVPKNHPDRQQASTLAALEAASVLARFGYSPEQIAPITQAILEHSYSRGLKPTSLESAILQDADRLDAIGAIGIVRAFSCGTLMQAEFYDPSDPQARNRPLDDRKFMLDHFGAKLLKLFDLLNTAPAKREGERRVRFMNSFLEQFHSELT